MTTRLLLNRTPYGVDLSSQHKEPILVQADCQGKEIRLPESRNEFLNSNCRFPRHTLCIYKGGQRAVEPVLMTTIVSECMGNFVKDHEGHFLVVENITLSREDEAVCRFFPFPVVCAVIFLYRNAGSVSKAGMILLDETPNKSILSVTQDEL